MKSNWRKRGTALSMCLVLFGSLLAGSVWRANAAGTNVPGRQDTQLGDLSAKYETGNASDPTIIADVNGDLGGKSYGIYMFASNAGTPVAFAKWCQEQPIYRYIGDALVQAYNYTSSGAYYPGYGSNFDTAWKNQGATPSDFQLFREAQHAYVQDNIYQALVDRLEANISGFNVSNYSLALKNVLWSRGVQHGVGGAYNMIMQALDAVGGFKGQSEAELIGAIYRRSGAAMNAADLNADVLRTTGESAKLSGKSPMSGATAEKYGVADQYMRYFYGNSDDVQLGVYYRLRISEPSDALEILYELNGSQCVWHDGVYQLASGSTYLCSDLTLNGSQAAQWTLTYFAGGYYTISDDQGRRLSASDGKVTLEAPGAGNAQKWVWDADHNSWQNRKTETYLAVSGNQAALSADPVAWSPKATPTCMLQGAYYPGNNDNVIRQGASSFPVRGVVSSACAIKTVAVNVLNRATGNKEIGKTIVGEYYAVSLEPLDDLITISKLSKGDYTFVVSANVGGTEQNILSQDFTVRDKSYDGGIGTATPLDEYEITFDPDGGTFTDVKPNAGGKYTKVVELGDPYGELPTVSKEGVEFSGWFMEDGTQVAPNSIAAAKNHTLTARYGKLYTYTFYNDDGSVFKTGQLPDGTLIPNPGNPVKAGDGTYVYSFDYWQIKGTENRYTREQTTINAASIEFMPVFSKEKVPEGGGETGGEGGEIVTGGYLTGISPGTVVSVLRSSGYTVYSGSTEVKDGIVSTGMTAKTKSSAVTIVVTGDVSGDGKISITDVVKLQSHVVGKTTLSGAYAKAADVNRDGNVTITDVVQAAQVTVGKRTIG